MLYVIGFLVRKERFYLEPQFSTLLLKNQEILMFKSGSVVIMTFWKNAVGSKDFGTILYGYESFINYDKEGIAKGDPNKE